MTALGLTVPLPLLPLHAQERMLKEAVEFGYTDAWSLETSGTDGLTPLALASAWTPELRLGTAILPVFTRGPALLAMSLATLAQAAPGRFVAGIGASSPGIVQGWNDLPFEEPWYRVRDTLRFLRIAMTGEKVTGAFRTFTVEGFRLTSVPDTPPPIYMAALREGMLRLAAREADGVILNWLSAEDTIKVASIAREYDPHKELVARIPVCPSEDTETVFKLARRHIAAYLNVPAYAAYHDWLGRGEALRDMWDAWKAGDRKAALRAIPDEVVNDLIVHGSPDACREHLQRYVDAGITTPVVELMPWGIDALRALRSLGEVRLDAKPALSG